MSAGSCFAANIVPYLEQAGFDYIRTDAAPAYFGELCNDRMSYAKFSAAYGNIYTARQAAQLLYRALGRFTPAEDRWVVADDLVIDPFRPGLRWPAQSEEEFEALTAAHLRAVLRAIELADCFIFTLGLTETWISLLDGAVFPACPGTVSGSFDPDRHAFINLSAAEVKQDLDCFIGLAREVNPALRFILTVSPVPLVATATDQHVLVATTYSKAVLRVAAEEVARGQEGVTYFPAYEIVTGPQAPEDYFEPDRREPSQCAIRAVMRCFLRGCETDYRIPEEREAVLPTVPVRAVAPSRAAPGVASGLHAVSVAITEALCEEAAAEL